MANSLIIVESPAKVKTIKKFLGKNYTVDAPLGHLIDMPKSSLGVDVEHDYEPKYITIRGKGELLAQLKKEAKNNEYCLFVEKEDKIGEGIYTITTKKKEKKYSTLMDHLENGAFILHLFHHLKGEVGSLQKTVMMKQ